MFKPLHAVFFATSVACSLLACSGSDDSAIVSAPPATTAEPTEPGAPAEPTTPATPAAPPKKVPANGSPGCAAAAKTTNATIDVAGTKRSLILAVPKAYDPYTAYPVVFVLHSGGGTGASARSYFAFDQLGVEEKAIIVYPDAVNKNWDLDAPSATNRDVAFFDALVDHVKKTTCVDASRIFATGTSQGAYLANQLGCRRGDVLRGIAPHAGGGPWESTGGTWDSQGHLTSCQGKPPAAMIFIGLADTSVKPTEGEKSVSHWSWANGCKAQTSPATPEPCVAFEGCQKPVVACRLPGVTHRMWSEGPKATWEFFSKL